jgi:hypothetical protein
MDYQKTITQEQLDAFYTHFRALNNTIAIQDWLDSEIDSSLAGFVSDARQKSRQDFIDSVLNADEATFELMKTAVAENVTSKEVAANPVSLK